MAAAPPDRRPDRDPRRSTTSRAGRRPERGRPRHRRRPARRARSSTSSAIETAGGPRGRPRRGPAAVRLHGGDGGRHLRAASSTLLAVALAPGRRRLRRRRVAGRAAWPPSGGVLPDLSADARATLLTPRRRRAGRPIASRGDAGPRASSSATELRDAELEAARRNLGERFAGGSPTAERLLGRGDRRPAPRPELAPTASALTDAGDAAAAAAAVAPSASRSARASHRRGRPAGHGRSTMRELEALRPDGGALDVARLAGWFLLARCSSSSSCWPGSGASARSSGTATTPSSCSASSCSSRPSPSSSPRAARSCPSSCPAAAPAMLVAILLDARHGDDPDHGDPGHPRRRGRTASRSSWPPTSSSAGSPASSPIRRGDRRRRLPPGRAVAIVVASVVVVTIFSLLGDARPDRDPPALGRLGGRRRRRGGRRGRHVRGPRQRVRDPHRRSSSWSWPTRPSRSCGGCSSRRRGPTTTR